MCDLEEKKEYVSDLASLLECSVFAMTNSFDFCTHV